MTVAELVPIYEDLHDTPPRSRNHAWLWRRCAWKIQERAYGGLSEMARRSLDVLVDRIEIPGRVAARTVASRLDARRGSPRGGRSHSGSFTEPVADGSEGRPRRPDLPPPGTSIVREWHGRELRLTFLDDGVEVGGAFHRSLTAAARAITGSKWNGRLFWFGREGRR